VDEKEEPAVEAVVAEATAETEATAVEAEAPAETEAEEDQE